MPTAPKLNRTLRKFIERQKMFFVATAAADGRVNVSPKGMDTLQIIDDHKITWLNLTGSGNETAAHLAESPRITLMFCAFEGDPMILRVYGTARVLHPRNASWDSEISRFPKLAGSRQIFTVTIDLVQTSCGTGVPVMNFAGDRADTEMVPYYAEMGEDGLKAYWQRKNTLSIDGKPTGIFADG
jgi:hypothetical protein